MQVAVHGGGDHEEQVAGLVVHGAVVHAGVQSHGCQTGALDRLALGVRHRDARLNGGAALGLAGQNGLLVGLHICQIVASHMQADQLVDGRFLIRCAGVQLHAFRSEQICNTHDSRSFLSFFFWGFDLFAGVRFCGSAAHAYALFKRASISGRVASTSENAVALPAALPTRRACS